MNSSPPFPGFIDNSARSSFVACPTRWYYRHILSLESITPSPHLRAGKAFAAALEAGRREFIATDDPTTSEARALQALFENWDLQIPDDPEVPLKSLPRLISALISYFDRYPFRFDSVKPYVVDGKPTVEFTFSVPLEILNPSIEDSNDPLIYAGRFDMIGSFNNALFVVDEKTTSSLGASWAGQWELDSQMVGYCWALQKYNFPVAGAILRGVGILTSSISHTEVIVYAPEWKLKRWHDNLLYDIRRMISVWRNLHNFIPQALDKQICRFCPYKILCQVKEPEKWIPQYFKKTLWTPLAQITPPESHQSP